jgi:hypothetical protein
MKSDKAPRSIKCFKHSKGNYIYLNENGNVSAGLMANNLIYPFLENFNKNPFN